MRLLDVLEGGLEGGDGAVDVLEFFEAEEADAEGLEVVRFVAAEGDAGGDLDAELGEFGGEGGVVCVGDDDAGGLKAGGGDAAQAVVLEHGADAGAKDKCAAVMRGTAALRRGK